MSTPVLYCYQRIQLTATAMCAYSSWHKKQWWDKMVQTDSNQNPNQVTWTISPFAYNYGKQNTQKIYFISVIPSVLWRCWLHSGTEIMPVKMLLQLSQRFVIRRARQTCSNSVKPKKSISALCWHKKIQLTAGKTKTQQLTAMTEGFRMRTAAYARIRRRNRSIAHNCSNTFINT